MKAAAVALALCLERASATACTCKATWSNSYCSNQAGCPATTCDTWTTNWCEVEPAGCTGSIYELEGFYWAECDATTGKPSRDLDGDGVADAAPEGSCCISSYGVSFSTNNDACGSTLAEVTANCCPSPFVARYHLTTEESTDSYDCVSFISKEDCNSYGMTWSGGDDDPIGLSAIGGCPHSAAALTTNSDVALACTNEEAALMSCVHAGHDHGHADTTSWGTGLGWCSSALDYDLGTTSSVDECWTQCENKYGAELVAVDWTSMYGWCYCQNDCQCMEDVGRGDHLVTSSSITALPGACSISGVLDDDFPETCSGVQEFVNEACGQAPSGCQNEYEAYVTCLYADRTATAGLDCDLTCAGALGGDGARKTTVFGALLGAAISLVLAF